MKKVLEYIVCVLLAVVIMPIVFVFTVGLLFIVAETGGDYDSMDEYAAKFAKTMDNAVDWVKGLF